METLPAALVRLDRDWTIAYVNANDEEIYGRTRDQLVIDGDVALSAELVDELLHRTGRHDLVRLSLDDDTR